MPCPYIAEPLTRFAESLRRARLKAPMSQEAAAFDDGLYEDVEVDLGEILGEALEADAWRRGG